MSGVPLSAKHARIKRVNERRIPICKKCGDYADRNDWLDYVWCPTCNTTLFKQQVKWRKLRRVPNPPGGEPK